MKNTKRRIEPLSFYDHSGISKHLEKMAQKGWLIEKITNWGWIYKKIEPQKLHFTVTYYPKASEFDPEPSESQKRFYDFCEHTGWKLACASAQMQIFYNEQENPIPIETDPVVEVDIIHKACKKSFLPAYALLFLLALLNGGLFLSTILGHPIDLLSSPGNLTTGMCWVILLIFCIAELVNYFTWHKRAVKAAEKGIFLDTPNTTLLQKGLLVGVACILIYWVTTLLLLGDKLQSILFVIMSLYMVILIFLVNAIKNFLKKKKVSTKTNRTLTIISSFVLSFVMMGGIMFFTISNISNGLFYMGEDTYEYKGETFVLHNDELPFVVEDIFDVTYDDYIKERRNNESLFLGEFVMRQRPRFDAANYEEIPQLEYTIVEVKVPFFYDWCKEELYYDGDTTKNDDWPDDMKSIYHTEDPVPWKANEAYHLYFCDGTPRYRYLLCYENLLVDIQFEQELSLEQMKVVAEKLTSFSN